MTQTENKTESVENERKSFSLLVFLASLLSLGSLAWTTWSLLDFFKVDSLKVEELGGVSLIGLSAALTMDIVWSATMYAEYTGLKLPYIHKKGKDEERIVNLLPFVGWIEVLFVAGLLGVHGSGIEGGAATFAAVLPVFTKFTWMLALNGLKDPYDLTDDEKAMLAAKKRKSRLTRADVEATSEQHDADMIRKNRDHDAALADERRRASIEREKVQAAIEREKLEREAKFEAEKAELEGANQLKAMRQRLSAQLQIETLRTQTEITMERLSAEQELRISSPIGFNMLQGQVVRGGRAQITSGATSFDEDDPYLEGLDLEGMELTDAKRRKATLAARYFAADAAEGGITRAAFARANQMGAPRVSEATTAFPLEWFIENGLAFWTN